MRVAVTPVDLHVSCVVTFDAAAGEHDQPYKIDWGDGTAIEQRASGASSGTHDYAKAGFYKVKVKANDTSSTQTITAGAPAMPAWNAEKVREARQGPQEDLAAIGATTGRLG